MNKIVLNGEEFDLYGPAGPDGNPIGTIISFMGVRAPKDYLICDGSLYKISDHPDLAAFFKQQFGSETYFGGTGANFAVPDMRNLFLRGYHGEAEERLSGEVGKKQEGTNFPNVYSANAMALFENTTRKNYDTLGQKEHGIIYTGTSSFTGDQPRYYTSRPVNMAILYCIKAVKSESEKRDDGEVYSTEETLIGTWIDGKPLYRRVFVGVTSPVENEWVVLGWTFLSVETVIKLEGCYLTEKNIWFSNPHVNGADGTVPFYIRFLPNSSLGLGCRIGLATATSRPLICIMEYTKTNDIATEALTSQVAAKSSGTINHGKEEYDYELPDIVSAASSASKTFDGIGSIANNI